ncbi:hypothetical protein [Thiolinea disciformis]|uniref:hypothetical protein n=1 Tax=Thiolinea disciformis TaxID=125614 RepID=UPI0003649445|nr:hypothetical protein [Thiolinea disciformis]
MNQHIEVIRENLTPAQVLAIREQAKKDGCQVNINRLHSQLVEIQIIHPNIIIDVNPNMIKGERRLIK